MRRKRSPRVSPAVAEPVGTCLWTPSRSGASAAWLLPSIPFAPAGALGFDLADMLISIQSGKRPGMQSRDSQGHLQTMREQTARGSRNSRALVTNTTLYEKPGQVARPGSPGGINGTDLKAVAARGARLLQALRAPDTGSIIMMNAINGELSGPPSRAGNPASAEPTPPPTSSASTATPLRR